MLVLSVVLALVPVLFVPVSWGFACVFFGVYIVCLRVLFFCVLCLWFLRSRLVRLRALFALAFLSLVLCAVLFLLLLLMR